MRNDRLGTLVEMALAIALCTVLNYIRVWLPINIAGGSISFDMLPIVIVALRRGPVAGIVTGALYGLVDLRMEPYVVAPVQLLLDYPMAFGAVGLGGLLRRLLGGGSASATRPAVVAAAAVVTGGGARFASHYASGVVFFGMNAPAGQPVWLYSLVYNASYMLPSILACAVAAAIVVPVLQRAVPAPARS